MTYRCAAPVSLAQHTAHWESFSWMSGPVRTKCFGPWGEVQVWAASEPEGRRVILHAAALSGWDVERDPRFHFESVHVQAQRYGRVTRMGLRYVRGLPCVSSRPGPDGAPNWDTGPEVG